MRAGQTDGQTDERTEWNKQIYPPTTSLCGGPINICYIDTDNDLILEIVIQ